eukprot:TRINITY_DN16212_c0_g1_i1.p1 TRINITY_DN16212_c0_g1~~TRINITY_DN16212_c0_g1_i1.p1  ORF type:complete len:469 (-),score=123.91 TRINITY_DN16212_c0_g1_i1:76-1434(-)
MAHYLRRQCPLWEVERALRLSRAEGISAGLASGFSDAFAASLVAVVAGGAPGSAPVYALAYCPPVACAAAQAALARAPAWARSRAAVVAAVCAQSACAAAMAALAALGGGTAHAWVAVLLVTLNAAAMSCAAPLWAAWISDLLALRSAHGADAGGSEAYFGSRNRLAGLASVAATLTGGALLRLLPGSAPRVLAALFACAAAARLCSAALLRRTHQPTAAASAAARAASPSYLAEGGGAAASTVRFLGFRGYTLAVAVASAIASVCQPFYAPFMLARLGGDGSAHAAMATSNAVHQLVKFSCMPWWGRVAGNAGAAPVLAASAALSGAGTVVWAMLPAGQFFFVPLVALQAGCGFCWAGYELLSFTVLLDVAAAGTSQDHDAARAQRTARTVWFGAWQAVACAVGGVVGTALVEHYGVAYEATFAVAGALRVALIAAALCVTFAACRTRKRQ